MKVVVFTKFPEKLSAQHRKHLEEDYGAEIVHWSTPNQSLQNPGCDVILTFFELMSHAEADIGARLAKRWDVRHVLLQRKASSWDQQLARVVNKVQTAKVAVNAPVPVVVPQLTIVKGTAPVSVAETMREAEPAESERPTQVPGPDEKDELWDEISSMFETEISDLQKKLTELGSAYEGLETRRLEENKKAAEQLRVEAKLRSEAENKAKALEQACNAIAADRKKIERDVEKLENENEEIDKALQSVKTELEVEKAKKSGGLAPAFIAVQTLYEAGAMDEEAAGKMLVNLLLKKK